MNASVRIFAVNDVHFSRKPDGETRFFSQSPKLFSEFVHVVNRERPDAVLFLGDICEGPADWETFRRLWALIDERIPKALTVGNHDLDEVTFSELEKLLGYDDRPDNGGSRFNQTFALQGIRVVLLDATFDAADAHGSHWRNVRLHGSAVAWLRSVLLASPEDKVLLCSHCLPHTDYFDEEQREEIRMMTEEALAQRPGLQIRWAGGHNHAVDIRVYENMGEKQLGYLLPAMVEGGDGRFTEIVINGEGFSFRKRDVLI